MVPVLCLHLVHPSETTIFRSILNVSFGCMLSVQWFQWATYPRSGGEIGGYEVSIFRQVKTLSRNGFCRNPIGIFSEQNFWVDFPNPPKNPQQNSNQNLGASRPKSTLQGSGLEILQFTWVSESKPEVKISNVSWNAKMRARKEGER